MNSHVRIRGGLSLKAFALGVGAWIASGYSVMAQGDPSAARSTCPTCHRAGHHKHPGSGDGTLGYGKTGAYPGFQGFGLGYHLGFGYGGAALGVGTDGGHPLYGGPGYPHHWPTLRRLGPITPFPYHGGPGYPTAKCPNYFGAVGPLVTDRPVIEIENEAGDADYGTFTGVLLYPENAFAPFTRSAAVSGSSGDVKTASFSKGSCLGTEKIAR